MIQLKTSFTRIDVLALLLSVALMALHFLMPRLRRQRIVPESWISSFGGGFAAAYVFLHLLPGFEQSKQAMGELLSERYRMTPLRDLLVYLTALVGFLFYFALQRRVELMRRGAGPSKSDFYLHVTATGLLNFIITYTMALRVAVGLDFAILFTVMMGLHFFMIDRNLETHYPQYFDGQGRVFLILCLLVGWLCSAVTEPNNIMLVAMLSSFLGGSVLFNVFRNEIPLGENSSFTVFVIGVTVGTLLLIAVTFLQGRA